MTPSAPDIAESDIADILAAHTALEGPLLPILHAVQARFGCIPDGARAPIAEALNITQAELHGVISFYHDFRRAPAGHHVLKVCRSEACKAVGADAVGADLLARLGLDWGQTSADGQITVEPVYCLGLCACAPAAMIDGQVRGRVTGAALAAEVGR